MNLLNSTLAADEMRFLNEFACLKQNYRVCENLDDAGSIVTDVTKLESSYLNKLLEMDINGFTEFGSEFSTWDCQVGLIFLARTLKPGLAGVEPDMCAARGIAEFVASNSWKYPASSYEPSDYTSTIGDSVQILNEIYLGNWAAIRSTEGNKTAQCYQSVTQLKELFDQAANLGIGKKGHYQVSDIDKLSIDLRTSSAISLVRAAAGDPNGNSYSKRLIERMDVLFPDITSDGAANPLLMRSGGDVLCASTELD
ncbi:MAG: hypothetical protein AAGB04_29445 [Pseudomonadota bacterium]